MEATEDMVRNPSPEDHVAMAQDEGPPPEVLDAEQALVRAELEAGELMNQARGIVADAQQNLASVRSQRAGDSGSYYTTTWAGLVRYQCMYCPVDSLDQSSIEEHVAVTHRDSLGMPAVVDPNGQRVGR